VKITSAEFLTAAADRSGWPAGRLPEVAFLGRSNVGKSSLLNCLVSRHGLARTSSTPGRTRLINFFCVNQKWIFADLPGFGYAKVSQEMRKNWQAMVEGYLAGREQLKAAVLILDLRREPGEEERDLLDWLSDLRIPFLLAATKADKLGKNERQQALAVMVRGLGLTADRITLFSAGTGEGREELWGRLLKLLG
jgi:GTP-binding protein